MEISSKAGGQESGRNQELMQQFKDLEIEWETLKKCKPLNTRRCSTGSDSGLMTSFGQLLENSPRGLMYSLQHKRSPSDGLLRVKSSDMAVEEILGERRAAIMSGKLKGRRLFGEAEGASEVELDLNYDDGGGGEICSDSLNMIREREVVINENCDWKKSRGEHGLPDAFRLSFSFSDTPLSEEKEVVEEEKSVVEERRGGGGCGGGGRCIVAMAWLAFLLILLILGLVSMSCNGKSVHEKELILVPT
ncbi:hypothetical protein Pfo_020271 [Paulownia fortunei]|nr:hypothetical protein Pfo_020271 [Paulownia fortunei]